MDKQQKRTLQTFRRVRDFLRRNAVVIRFAKLDAQLDALAAVVDRLTAYSVEQDTRTRLAKSGTTTLARQVRQLRMEFMVPISRFGRTLARHDSALQRALTIPRKADAEGIVAAALGMADAAEAQKAAFAAGGFSADFAEQLRAVARELKATIDDRAKDIGRRNASTAGVREEISRGRAILALLDAMVSPVLEATPPLLTEWRTLKKQLRPGATVVGEGDSGEGTGGAVGTGSGDGVPLTPGPVVSLGQAEVKVA